MKNTEDFLKGFNKNKIAMTKKIFWREGVPGTLCMPCPFVGVNISSKEEFIDKILKERLFIRTNKDNPNEGYYPPVRFSLRLPDMELLFCGTRYSLPGAPRNPYTNKPYKWAIRNKETGGIYNYYDIRHDFDKLFPLFKDSSEVEARMRMVEGIIRRNGGITVDITL